MFWGFMLGLELSNIKTKKLKGEMVANQSVL